MSSAQLNIGNLWLAAPLIVMTVLILLLIIIDVVLKLARKERGITAGESVVITVAGLAAAFVTMLLHWSQLAARGGSMLGQLFTAQGPLIEAARRDASPAWSGGALVVDHFSLFVCGAILGIGLLSSLLLYNHTRITGSFRPEIYPLLVTSLMGMVLLGMSRDLLVTFIAIEILSLPLYVLCGMEDQREAGKESSLKYFLLGAFASGFFIYGAALIYGIAGHLNYAAVTKYIFSALEISPILLIGVALVGVGFAFKLAMAPFHAWAPDVYQGAPTPLTGFMAAGVKLAVFAAAIRIIVECFGRLDPGYWRDALSLFAVLSMVLGNLLALHQMSAKRLLAYSAIAHTGYLAVALAAGTPAIAQSMMVYLVAYGIAALGAFGIISYLAPQPQDDIYLDELHDLWRKAPASAIALTVLLLSMGGMPLTAGFIGKLVVFKDAWNAGLMALVIIAVLNSVVSFYYYLRFVMAMYMQPSAPGAAERALPRIPAIHVFSSVLTVGLTLLLGVLPALLIGLLRDISL